MQVPTDPQARRENRGSQLNPNYHAPMNPMVGYPGLTHNQYPPSTQMYGKTVDELTQAFAGLNTTQAYNPVTTGVVAGNGYVPAFSHMQMMNSMQANTSGQIPSWSLPDGRHLYSTRGPPAAFPNGNAGFVMPGQHTFFPPPGFPAVSNAPGGITWVPAQHGIQDIPDLSAPRRTSLSSNEEVGPQTPYFNAAPAMVDYRGKGFVMNYSPHSWSTSSPHQLGQPLIAPQQLFKRNGQYVPADLTAICMADPAIPPPVPAIFSGDKGRGTLDKSLKNETNTTNVYIRGLHPDTTDEMLHAYGAKFGEILSAKSMLDQATGFCKGFGFIRYHNFDDGENCIRGFFHMGYEAKWARISHNEKLKTLGDLNNTNLYVSNLPLDFNENMLMSVFCEFEVLSAKILRDQNGLSRGVGFARFATPEICLQVIENYSGTQVGEEGNPLSIRFADTPDQKKLKNVTAERRQFKTNEYNTAAYGPGSPYHSSATGSVPSPLQTRGSPWGAQSSVPVSSYPAYTMPAARVVGPFSTPSAENTHPASRLSRGLKVESPLVTAYAKRTAMDGFKTSPIKVEIKAEEEDSKPSLVDLNTMSAAGNKSSPMKANSESPAYLSPSKSATYKLSPSKSAHSLRG